MNRARRFATAASILVIVLIGFVTLASFAVTRAANGDGVIARATHTAVMSLAGGVANAATSAVRLAGQAAQAAETAKDCARICSPSNCTEAMSYVASRAKGNAQSSFGAAAHRFASAKGDKQCSFSEAASYLASGEFGLCTAKEALAWSDTKVCAPSSHAAVAVATAGAVTGNFMSQLSSACQSACGTSNVDRASVVAQPGAQPGDVAQCPVSGAVFTVRENHPGWGHEGTAYYTCCGTCAGILAKNPERFLELGAG